MKTTIYRLAHRVTKYGPWRALDTVFASNLSDSVKKALADLERYINSLDQYCNYKKHPLIRTDITGWTERLVCAVPNIKDLRNWFHDETLLIHLMLNDFTVYAITIDSTDVSYGRSGKQCAFDDADDYEIEDVGLDCLLTER